MHWKPQDHVRFVDHRKRACRIPPTAGKRQEILEQQTQVDPANRVLRQELAFNSLFLGELHFHIRFKMEDAVPFWELAARNYELRGTQQVRRPDWLPLSIACMRLMVNDPPGATKPCANTRATEHLSE